MKHKQLQNYTVVRKVGLCFYARPIGWRH